MNSNPLVRVFILSYLRPEYIQASIDSVLRQDYPNFEIIVSDNSPNDTVIKQLQMLNNPRITIIHQTPAVTAIQHHNNLLTMIEGSDFFMMFHDDDILYPNAITTLVKSFDENTAAVGTNALIIEGDTLTPKLFGLGHSDQILKKPSALVSLYLSAENWHAAFSSYLYRTRSIGSLHFEVKKGGKHSDVTFLAELLKSGSIKMLAQPLMYYRRHSNNGSGPRDFKAAYSLARYAKNVGASKELISNYLHKNFIVSLAGQLFQEKNFNIRKRQRVYIQSSLSFLIKNPKIVFKRLFT